MVTLVRGHGMKSASPIHEYGEIGKGRNATNAGDLPVREELPVGKGRPGMAGDQDFTRCGVL